MVSKKYQNLPSFWIEFSWFRYLLDQNQLDTVQLTEMSAGIYAEIIVDKIIEIKKNKLNVNKKPI